MSIAETAPKPAIAEPPARELLQEVTPESINAFGVFAREWLEGQKRPTKDWAGLFAAWTEWTDTFETQEEFVESLGDELEKMRNGGGMSADEFERRIKAKFEFLDGSV